MKTTTEMRPDAPRIFHIVSIRRFSGRRRRRVGVHFFEGSLLSRNVHHDVRHALPEYGAPRPREPVITRATELCGKSAPRLQASEIACLIYSVGAMASIARSVYGEPGSVYARRGGVFGISAFVDRCMDRWMADKLLNENPMVTRWHFSAQRPGFKFLVAQLMCHMTGGPQRYTGRDMATSHKHLNISATEWARFMEIFGAVCAEFGLPADDQEALTSLLASMMDDCIIAPGEKVPPDPGPTELRGNSLYARVGDEFGPLCGVRKARPLPRALTYRL